MGVHTFEIREHDVSVQGVSMVKAGMRDDLVSDGLLVLAHEIAATSAFSLARSLRFARRIAVAMKGATSLENAAGSPRLRSVIRVEVGSTAVHV